jgi:UDPglucose--hexose-1-phosphate uridylyltransferase
VAVENDISEAGAGVAEAGLAAATGRLVAYAIERGIVEAEDARWAYNRLLECAGQAGPSSPDSSDCARAVRSEDYDFERDLAILAEAAILAGQAEDTATGRDRISMRLVGSITPRPSEVNARFGSLYDAKGAEAATDWFYSLCCDVDYVRRSAIAKNLEWTTETEWGALEITINKSKPEKDPRDIAAAGRAQAGEKYPACQLCRENEGYSGRAAADAGGHPARQNLRIVSIELGGEKWGLQYSPYAYYPEHCIAMSNEHRPMHVDEGSMSCLLDFVDLFPHYFVGSNADLPIVGGSILSHDHFQGGRHEFAMTRADVVEGFEMPGFADVTAGVLKWPLTVLRLSSLDRAQLLAAATHVLDAWRSWTDESVGVVAFSADGTPHNTVTPICRRRGEAYELDLALRCNVTTDEHPLGVFHPHADKWHVKKENIGLIEVMGLAILPPRLEEKIESGELAREEIGRVFAGVLEDAGVFKWDEAGRAALGRFIASL